MPDTDQEKKQPRRDIPAIIAVFALFVAVLSLYSQKLQESKLEKLREQNESLSNELRYLRQADAQYRGEK